MKIMKKVLLFVTILSLLIFFSCSYDDQKSEGGVSKAKVEKVQTDQDGRTIEQHGYNERVKRDNTLGSIKHLYIISSFTGSVLEYSTVKGKVISGGKRISPKTVNGGSDAGAGGYNYTTINGKKFTTNEVIDEYGMFGESANYIYWFDANDVYHQYFPSGGTYLHVSEKPLRPREIKFVFE